MSDHRGGPGDSDRERYGDHQDGDVDFPTPEHILMTNRAFQELGEARRQGREPNPPAGMDLDDWRSARRFDDAWAERALREHGSVGRDPGRIDPLLERVEEVWGRRPELSFGEFIASVIAVRNPEAQLWGPEDDVFIELLEDLDRTPPASHNVRQIRSSEDRDPRRIAPLLDRLGTYWKIANPDLRFGQLVSNIVRFHPGEDVIRDEVLDDFPNSLLTMTDVEYLELVEQRLAEALMRGE